MILSFRKKSLDILLTLWLFSTFWCSISNATFLFNQVISVKKRNSLECPHVLTIDFKCDREFQMVHWNTLLHLKSVMISKAHEASIRWFLRHMELGVKGVHVCPKYLPKPLPYFTIISVDFIYWPLTRTSEYEYDTVVIVFMASAWTKKVILCLDDVDEVWIHF